MKYLLGSVWSSLFAPHVSYLCLTAWLLFNICQPVCSERLWINVRPVWTLCSLVSPASPQNRTFYVQLQNFFTEVLSFKWILCVLVFYALRVGSNLAPRRKCEGAAEEQRGEEWWRDVTAQLLLSAVFFLLLLNTCDLNDWPTLVWMFCASECL